MSRDDATLLDILKASNLIIDFAGSMIRNEFEKDYKTQSAVLHQLLIIGEAVKRLTEDFRHEHPSVPWSNIAGMGDRLIHGYDDVDFSEVWNTIQNDIPSLLNYLKNIIPSKPD
jgi:uncharacterized protein with HEPN domain